MNPEPVGSIRNPPVLKAVYFDLDGTLLDENRQIPPRAAAKLQAMKDRGVRLGVATGRMFAAAAPYVRRMGCDAPLILYNGARIVDPQNGRVLGETLLPAARALAGLAVARLFSVHVNLYVGDGLFMESQDEHGRLFLEKEKLEAAYVDDLGTLITADPVKVLFIGPPETLRRMRAEVAEATEHAVNLVFSEPQYLEMLAPSVSKGTALERACQMMKIGLAETAAFGDAPNDAEMLSLAGAGVAMENADDGVRQAARFFTGPNHGDGIVDALNALFPEH